MKAVITLSAEHGNHDKSNHIIMSLKKKRQGAMAAQRSTPLAHLLSKSKINLFFKNQRCTLNALFQLHRSNKNRMKAKESIQTDEDRLTV